LGNSVNLYPERKGVSGLRRGQSRLGRFNPNRTCVWTAERRLDGPMTGHGYICLLGKRPGANGREPEAGTEVPRHVNSLLAGKWEAEKASQKQCSC
jgi:hypothetical protein